MGPIYCELLGTISGSWENSSLYSPHKMGLLAVFWESFLFYFLFVCLFGFSEQVFETKLHSKKWSDHLEKSKVI